MVFIVNHLLLKEIFRYLNATPSSRCINEGECLVNASHIISCGKTTETQDTIKIQGLCLQTSALSSAPHIIIGQFNVSQEEVVIDSFTCSCKAGCGGCCKHIAAVLIYCTRLYS
ncbi:hypothetical protein NQ315_007338 [Exocentrus adspersus]|uniref:SWIM-type domain-containing protein n=1 Tax=Exocentrus adspersus TaxID=1586481 RepID=A0AAV8V626_9CUCU|nr:hypothetical protein NQ315_007338 [Exocentrus adspersus]